MKIVEIFDFISEKEDHAFEVGIAYTPKTKFKIATKDGMIPVRAMIVKKDTSVTLTLKSGKVLRAGAGHRISTDSGLTAVADLSIGDKLENVNGNEEIAIIETGDEVLVYDITIDTEDHLYLDAAGFVHHNTYHITEGPRGLEKILGPEGDKWTYHSGIKVAPLSFYSLLFRERNKIIVFDEADSILKHDDVVMMLKPILDTSGKNVAAYGSNTKNMVGLSDDEIRDYCDQVDSELDAGGRIGIGKNDVMLPGKFFFEGAMIFISNMPAKKIEGAILSRSIFVDVHLAEQDVLKRIRSIAHITSKYDKLTSPEDVEMILEALGFNPDAPTHEITYMTPEHARKTKKITVRAYALANTMRKAGLNNWVNLAALYA